MQVSYLDIPDVLIFEPTKFEDERGFFIESFNQLTFEKIIGRSINFVQDNHSCSTKNVLRGLHYQIEQTQGKLVRVISGAILDVAVDLRENSPYFGSWVAVELTDKNFKQLWIPEGFAHGFITLSDRAELLYKTTEYWAPQFERCIKWNDPTLRINWPANIKPILSPKDQIGALFEDAEIFCI